MKITAKENDVDCPSATIVSAFEIKLKWACCKFIWSVGRKARR